MNDVGVTVVSLCVPMFMWPLGFSHGEPTAHDPGLQGRALILTHLVFFSLLTWYMDVRMVPALLMA
jgi:hypothetical protein